LPSVDDYDNRRLAEMLEKHARLCQLIRSGKIDWSRAIRVAFYEQIYHTCRMEENPLTLGQVYDWLRAGGPGGGGSTDKAAEQTDATVGEQQQQQSKAAEDVEGPAAKKGG
jgi:hypothetical protein